MVRWDSLHKLSIFLSGVILITGCSPNFGDNSQKTGRKPLISPDYTDVTIPPNIAPMNFKILEEGKYYIVNAVSASGNYQVKIKSKNGIIKFSAGSWRKLLDDSRGSKITFRVYSAAGDGKAPEKYEPFYMEVAAEPIDPYLAYRVIHPGYYSWSNIKIVQRCIESFYESSLVENQIIEKNCINCHSFNNNSPERFMIHMRGSLGGTYFVDDGRITRTDPRIDEMPGGATYPSWHPDGRFLAFSSNQVRQSFYSVPEKRIEVFDLVSSLILFDRQSNEIVTIHETDTTRYLSTFPSWSPDGKYLYFCRAVQHINASDPTMEQIMMTRYDLVRKSFDAGSRTFGETEIVFNASGIGKSASFPRISPDGKFLVFTLHDYGTFPIWHQEADLWLLEMQSKEAVKMRLNSNRTESYHAWSSSGRWLVFSSKRADGRSARPYFSYIDSLGNQKKEFVLPQEDPELYNRMLESFNIPEFVTGRIKVGPKDFEKATKQQSEKAKSGNKGEQAERAKVYELKINERPIH